MASDFDLNIRRSDMAFNQEDITIELTTDNRATDEQCAIDAAALEELFYIALPSQTYKLLYKELKNRREGKK